MNRLKFNTLIIKFQCGLLSLILLKWSDSNVKTHANMYWCILSNDDHPFIWFYYASPGNDPNKNWYLNDLIKLVYRKFLYELWSMDLWIEEEEEVENKFETRTIQWRCSTLFDIYNFVFDLKRKKNHFNTDTFSFIKETRKNFDIFP